MSFNSPEFVLFFLLVAGTTFFVPQRWRWGFLLAASCYFYGVWNWLVLAQLVAVIGLSYWFGLRIEAETDAVRKRRWTTAAIVLLAGNLFVFKYTAFANESLRALFGGVGLSYPVPVLRLLLPIGISFYTFQLIGYIVDTYKGGKAERHLGVFALFVLFFPKLVAGPIERSKGLLPQLHTEQFFDRARIVAGLRLMLWGAFQKIVVADRLAPAVDAAYANPQEQQGVVMVFATFLFAFQVYCDFAGYSDMALGAAQILGYKLTKNFNRPYFAISIQDFWKRWHISLSSWLTDYVYTPLTRTKVKIKWYTWMQISLFITFVVSGFWHGAAWTFVIWGALHGAYLVAAMLSQKTWTKIHKRTGLLKRQKLHARLKIAATFSLVCFAYIFFRASSVSDAFYIATHLHTGWAHPFRALNQAVGAMREDIVLGLFGASVVLLAEWLDGQPKFAASLETRPRWVRWSVYYAGVVAIVLLGALIGTTPQFIYVQF
jgi:alginate O-acetyltransferase complex protein AlgI